MLGLLILDVDKKCSFLDIVLCFFNTSEAICYGSNSGKDANNRLPPADTYLMVTRANNTGLGLSNPVLFGGRGTRDVPVAGNGSNLDFISSGTSGKYIIFTVYDDGSKPRPFIFGSIQENIWTPRGSP